MAEHSASANVTQSRRTTSSQGITHVDVELSALSRCHHQCAEPFRRACSSFRRKPHCLKSARLAAFVLDWRRFTSSSYRPEDQTGVSQTTLNNLDAPPAFYGEIAALYRTTYFSYGASLSAQYNRLTQESAFYELNYMELPLVLALRLGVHPYDDRLSIYAGAGAAFVRSTTELTSSVIELDKSASTTSTGPALTSGISYALTPAHSLSLTWTHTFSDDANISATNFGWTYTFGKE